MTRPVAVLDANVLIPFQLRNFLLHLAAEELYDPLWSEQIVAEFGRHLLAGRHVTQDQLDHLTGQMRRVFGDDTLLPRLISGELRVPEVERIVEQVV